MEVSEPVRGMISEFVGPVDPNKRLRVYVCDTVCVMTNLNIFFIFIYVVHVSSSFCIGSTGTILAKEYLKQDWGVPVQLLSLNFPQPGDVFVGYDRYDMSTPLEV